MRKIIDEVPTPIRELSPETPAWMVALVEQLMAKKKEDRFATAKEVLVLLDACLSHVQQPLSNPIPSKLVINQPPTIVKLPERLRVVFRLQPRSIFPLLTGVCSMTTISVLLLWMTGGLGLLVQDPLANQEKTAIPQSGTYWNRRIDV